MVDQIVDREIRIARYRPTAADLAPLKRLADMIDQLVKDIPAEQRPTVLAIANKAYQIGVDVGLAIGEGRTP